MSLVGKVEPELNAPIAVASMTGRRRPREVGDSTERVNVLEAVVRYALYIAITLFLFVPFVMTVLSSFKTSAEVIAFPPTILPSVWHPENYLNVLTQITGFPRMVFNSFFVTLLVVALNLFFDSLVGYAFARLEFRFKNTLFSIIIAGSVLAILPILIVYIAGQRYFVRGIATTGMK